MDRKKVLILYTSIGLGHKSIAENVGFYLGQAGFEVELYDAHKVQDGWLARSGKSLYQFLIARFPFIWDWLYNTKWFISATLPFRTAIAGFNYKNIQDVINQLQPDIIISTHNTASAIVAYLKQKKLYRGAFGIAFSDFHLHRFWLFKQADFYLANIQEQKKEMADLGISPEKIFVCGIILRPKPDIKIIEVKASLGIKPGEKVVLISSGSQGTGIDEKLIKQLIAAPGVRVIVVCGKNKKLEETLSNNLKGTGAIVLGYHQPMDELYAIADVFITKPGGLSIAEALRWHLPIIISHLLPGQEAHNYSYLLNKKLVMPQAANLPAQVLQGLQDNDFKKMLQNNLEMSKILGDGQAIIVAVKQVMD